MEFSEIRLTKNEYKALKETVSGNVLLKLDNKDFFYPLRDMDLVEIYPIAEHKSDYGTFDKYASVTERGRLYLRYASTEKTSGRKHVAFEIFLILFSAAVTLALEHIHELLSFFRTFFEKLF